MTIDNNSTTFSCISTNSLEDFSMIGGSYFVLTFNVVDENGVPIDLNGSNPQWLLSVYGDPNNPVLQKDGVITGAPSGIFTVILEGSDTFELSGKYIQQPILVDSMNNDFRLGQGVINITKAIPYI
jgi:hypothetical protein